MPCVVDVEVTMERKHWTLLAVAAAGGERVSPVQLQKVLFLLGREMPDAVRSGYYEFRPYNYGPFDSAVYADAQILADEGLININRPYRWDEYSVTPKGVAVAQRLRDDASPGAVVYLEKVVHWALSLSFQDLVRAIYARYPDTRAKSIFEDRGT